jgi:membrane-associated phospholipid phosphatase
MDVLNGMGVEWVLFFQNLNSWLITVFKFFAFLGDQYFYFLILPVIYWSINPALGLQLGVILNVSNGLNVILKVVFHTPRPSWVSREVTTQEFQPGFGVPSGHAQNSVVLWGTIAYFLKKWWAWGVAILIIIMTGLSRLVLGVHFPIDVFSGWIIGTILLYLSLSLSKPIIKWLQTKETGMQVLLVLGFTLVFLLLGSALTLFTIQTTVIPETWIQNAVAANPGEIINPYSLDALLISTGSLFGLAGGAIILKAQGGFQVKGSLVQHALRYILGTLGVVIIWLGLGQIFPEDQDLISYGLRYLRYALVGAWISWWAPLLFVRLGWAAPGTGNQAKLDDLPPEPTN